MSGRIDLAERAREAIIAGTQDVPDPLLRPLPEGTEGVTIRPAPPTVTQTYMDGTQEVAYLLNVYVRNTREDVAYEQAQACSWAIQRGDLRSKTGGYVIDGISEYSGTTEVGQPADGMHTVMVGLRASLTIRP